MAFVGQIGFGLVWGWFAGNYYRAWRKRRFLLSLAFFALTGLASVLVAWMVTVAAVLPFLIAATLALFVHIGWQNKAARLDAP